MDYYSYFKNIDYMNQLQSQYEISRLDIEPWPLTFENKSKQYLLNKAISNIKDYIMDETNDTEFYDTLLALAPNEEQKKIIEDIRDDEKIHVKIFRKIFTMLTGVILPSSNDVPKKEHTNLSYSSGLKKALFGELDAVKKYRETMAYMPSKELYNMLMYVLTDEIRHANKYNYLISVS